MAAPIEVRVPDLGGFADVSVIDVLVKEGESVEVDTPLVTLETEKATMDVPSTTAGRVVSLQVKKGSKVSQGSVVVLLEPSGGAAAAPGAAEAPQKTAGHEPTIRQPALQVPPAAEKRPSTDTQPIPRTAPAAAAAPAAPTPAAPASVAPAVITGDGIALADFSGAYAGPSVRKFARELGVDLVRVKGSGLKGRVTHDDVKAFVKQVMTGAAPAAGAAPGGASLPKVPEVDFAKFGPIETKPLLRIQKISGARLHASWVNLPHVTQFDAADITEMENVRNQLKTKAAARNIKLTPLAFIIKACVKALQEYPQFNASLDASGENLVLKKYMHIGFAADTPNGLLVPVIRDADRKDIYELAKDLGELSAKAREGKLSGPEMQGGCFTVSSLGSIGGTAFTPIINAPEVAILGVSRAEHKPVYKDGTFVPRLMLPLSLSYDHRVIDGALAVRFTTFLSERMAEVRGLLEAIP